MAALRDAHRYALFGNLRPRHSDETEHNRIASLNRLFEKCDPVSNRVREDGFKDKALALAHQIAADGSSYLGRLVDV